MKNSAKNRLRLSARFSLIALVGLALASGAATVRGQNALDGFDPNANGTVRVVVVQPDGKILIGGDFTTLAPNGGAAVTRNRIARLNPDGTLDTVFNPNASDVVYTIAVQADGKILVGGHFNGANSIGGQTRNRIARLDATTGLADSFNPNANGFTVFTIAVQADGKILAAGSFTSIGGQPRNNIARLDAITGLADSFNPNAEYIVHSIAVQADGKILVGGQFSGANSIGGQTRNYIARLDGTTGLADSFNPNASDEVFSIAVQADGKVLAGGQFTSIGGQTRNYIARLDGTTGLADSFNPNANLYVTSIAVQADGKILTGGHFSSIGGQPRNRIGRLDATTGLADSFDPNASGAVLSIAVQADGKILAGGEFTSIGGQPRNRIGRLDATTGLADSFNPNANNVVGSIAVQADGKVLAGGYFSGANSIGGQTRNYIARLDPVTGLADSFNPNANNVGSIAVQADGKILVGGAFTSIGGQPRNVFARLSNDTAALQNLAVTQTTITWTLGGSTSQFTRVPFESSTDNVNYTPLGSGTATGSNWTLTGLNLPTGQNFYIRARGYYSSGADNASESITESVRNAFISMPPIPTQAVSRKIHGAAGTFDINLPLTGNVGIECRSGGATNDYQMIINFANSVTVESASVTSGTGSVSSFSVSGSQVTVNLTGVTNVQRITVTLMNVNDGTHMGNVPVSMGVLVGDVNGNAAVNASDVSLTKSQVGQAVSGSNFREDVNANGTISSTDVALVKSDVGTALPP
jgi:uncharacterized delta-60 repeat protein